MLKIKELFGDITKYKNNKITYFGIIVVIVHLYWLIDKSYKDNNLRMLILSLMIYIVILIGLSVIYFDDIYTYIRDQYKGIRNLSYFNILEKNAKTDTKKRQELVCYVNNLFLILYFLLLYILLPVKVIFEFDNGVAVFLIVITFLVVFLPLLKYNTFPFYVLPLVIICLKINNLDYSIYSNFIFMIEILIAYFFLLLIYPATYLRKLEKNITILAGLVVILITLIIQAYLELDNLSELSYTARNILEKLLELNKFLIISAYSLGVIIIKLRLNYFDKKAEKYYNKLLYDKVLNDKEDIYSICKYCVFYGGESYKNRILDNKVWREIICEIEQSYLQELLQNSENSYLINITKRMKSIFKK